MSAFSSRRATTKVAKTTNAEPALKQQLGELLAGSSGGDNEDTRNDSVRRLARDNPAAMAAALRDLDPRDGAEMSDTLYTLYAALSAEPEHFGQMLGIELDRMLRFAEEGRALTRIKGALDGLEHSMMNAGSFREELLVRCVAGLDSPQPLVRRTAARFAGDLVEAQDASAIRKLTQCLGNDGDWRVRALAFESLAFVPEVQESVGYHLAECMSHDPEPLVRLFACWVCQFVADPQHLRDALKARHSDVDRRVRRAAYLVYRGHWPRDRVAVALWDRVGAMLNGDVPNPVSKADLEDVLADAMAGSA